MSNSNPPTHSAFVDGDPPEGSDRNAKARPTGNGSSWLTNFLPPDRDLHPRTVAVGRVEEIANLEVPAGIISPATRKS
jgi:hypothetical protein